MLLAVLGLAVLACQEMKKEETTAVGLPEMSREIMAKSVIYEANIRQYSPEGSFNAFAQDLPELKKLGVDIIWLMPVYPISTTNSKGSLGSYYAVSDYTGVNPEFGTLADLKALINQAHELGMYVILDWVPNHTGWDHHWLKSHPDWYTQNEQGQPTHPVGTDWTDTADLNYDSAEMRAQMVKDMQYWITEAHIDGFRCDMAGMVPVDFWATTIPTLRAMKPIMMLAEAWEPALIDAGFDMAYGWETHHISNRIARTENDVNAWRHRMDEVSSMYPSGTILMNFTSNHDENSWNGSAPERLGPALETAAALMYTAPGMPLIYSGQEYNLDKRLLFFEKDSIDRVKSTMFGVYERLGALKKATNALDAGHGGAAYKDLPNSAGDRVLSFERSKGEDRLYYIANFSAEPKSFTVDIAGSLIDYMTGQPREFAPGDTWSLAPYQYHILLPKTP